MGFNTTVVILNDSLYDIENDPDFGKNLAIAINTLSGQSGPISVPSGGSGRAASVIETHHSDYAVLIVTGCNSGNNMGTIFPHGRVTDDKDVKILRGLADKLGYRIAKKPIKKK